MAAPSAARGEYSRSARCRLWPVVDLAGSPDDGPGRYARVMDLVKPIFAEFSFDPLATFTMINERAMIGILNIAYDKSDAEETVRAGICYDGLFKALTDEGYFPYRTGLRGIPKLSKEGDVFLGGRRANQARLGSRGSDSAGALCARASVRERRIGTGSRPTAPARYKRDRGAYHRRLRHSSPAEAET